MGDTINVASRLKGLNTSCETAIVASSAVVAVCHGDIAFKLLGRQTVKGRLAPIDVFEVVSTLDPIGAA